MMISKSASRSPYTASPTSSKVDIHASHGIHQLSFDRSARSRFREKWKDTEPSLPDKEIDDGLPPPRLPSRRDSNDNAPKLPSRPKPEMPPKLPQRPSSSVGIVERDLDVGLARPVAKKSAPVIPEKVLATEIKPRKPSPRPGPPTGKSSFTQMEKQIKESGVPKISFSPQPATSAKPLAANNDDQKPPKPAVGPKPAKSPVEKKSISSESSPSSSLSVSSKKTTICSEPTIKPPRPAKPSFKTYDAMDTEELKNHRLRLSPTKAPTTTAKPTKTFNQEPDGLLHGQIEKLGGNKKVPPGRPIKPISVQTKEPEALSALSKLKPTKPPPEKPRAKPEAIEKLEKLKARKTGPQGTTPSPVSDAVKDKAELNNKVEPPKAANFHDHLSSLLRPSTEPLMSTGKTTSPPMAKPIKRSLTFSAQPKNLEHVTKSRAKGPKRRLPKSVAASDKPMKNSTVPAQALDAEKGLAPQTKAPMGQIEKSAPVTSARPQKKVPPPIKAKKPDIKSRNISG